MKNLIFILTLFISINAFSQKPQSDEYKKFIEKIKKGSKTDKSDKTVLNLLNDIYEQTLQSDKGELNQDIPQRIQNIYADKKVKNLHILSMFLAYQEHISQTEADGKKPNANFLVYLMNELENDVKNLYGNVPIIIIIHKSEALYSDGQTKESAEYISKSLNEYPESIPLKVYNYLHTKDEKIKSDLLKNHPNHWMVKEFGII